MTSEEFGKKLKELRLAKGLTQDQLACGLGYRNRSSINKIEVNGRDIPRDKVLQCARMLGVDPRELL